MVNKYHAKKVKTKDGTFDSRAEHGRYLWLKAELDGGLISDLERQVPFTLIPAQRGADGKVKERACIYYADFVYYRDGKMIVEDVKGVKTPEYIIKRKLMLERYGIEIMEVRK